MTNREACLNAYERVLKIYELGLADYFKRTQILMVVIQSVMFLAFGKLVQTSLIDPPNGLGENGNEWASFIMLISLQFIPAAGVCFALTWSELIKRRYQYVDCYRWYLRDLECRLVSLGIHLDYFSVESRIFRLGHAPLRSRWSGEVFPPRDSDDTENRRPKPIGGLMSLDMGIPKVLSYVWFLFFFFVPISLAASCIVKVSLFRNKELCFVILPWFIFLVIIIYFYCLYQTEYMDEMDEMEINNC